VLELAIEQAKIEDQVFTEYGTPFHLFLKGCNSYGMMKTGSTNEVELNKNAKVIKNNINGADYSMAR